MARQKELKTFRVKRDDEWIYFTAMDHGDAALIADRYFPGHKPKTLQEAGRIPAGTVVWSSATQPKGWSHV